MKTVTMSLTIVPYGPSGLPQTPIKLKMDELIDPEFGPVGLAHDEDQRWMEFQFPYGYMIFDERGQCICDVVGSIKHQ